MSPKCTGREPTSPSLESSVTQAHLVPPLCPPPHPHHPLPVRSVPETNQLGDPLTERPIVNQHAYQLACWAPSTVSPSAFLLPIRAGGGVCCSKATGSSCGQAISGLVSHPHCQSPLKPLAETEGHSLVPCRGPVPAYEGNRGTWMRASRVLGSRESHAL